MSSSDNAIAGVDCKAYHNTGTASVPVWAEMENIKSLSAPDAADKVDASARYSRAKKYLAGQSDASVAFQYQYFNGSADTVFSALRTAYYAGTPIQVALADGAITTVGTTYSKDWYVITKFDTTEDLAGSKVYDIELAPTPYFDSGTLQEKSFTTVSE